MRFNTLFVLAGAFATVVSADEKAFEKEISSLSAALETNSAWISVWSNLATKTAALKSYEAFQTSIAGLRAHTGTLKSNYLEALPTEIRPIYSSYMSAQVSIASKNGIVLAIEGAPTSVAKAAAPSSNPLRVGAVVAAGFLGAVVAM